MIPPTSNERFLIIGEPRIVAETAAFLERKGAEFIVYISDALLNSQSPLIESEQYAKDSIASRAHFDSLLEDYHDHLISSLGDILDGREPTIIADLALARAELRYRVLNDALDLSPGAIVLSSTLTCTATELTNLLNAETAIVGFNGMPGWTSCNRIELAPALQASRSTIERARSIFTHLGIETELVEDRIGLVSPRIIALLINEAAFAAMENIATPRDIDRAIKLGVNYPHGLLEWADMLGIDCVLSILDALYDEYREPRYRACPLLRQYVRAGWLGRSTGNGFFYYTEDQKHHAPADRNT